MTTVSDDPRHRPHQTVLPETKKKIGESVARRWKERRARDGKPEPKPRRVLSPEDKAFLERVKERLLARAYRSERCDGLPDPNFSYEDVPWLEDDVWER